MISPEMLRRYPFFAHLNDSHMKALAMLAEESTFKSGEIIFEADEPADALYFLIEGTIELHYIVIDRDRPHLRKDFFVGEINPGEPFGISALIEPYCYTARAVADGPGRMLKIAAASLRTMTEADPRLSCILMRNLARAAMSRLHDTRIQLAATRA